jgi:hypothetical protein
LPERASLGEFTVTAQIEERDGAWEALIILSRQPDRPPIDASELEVILENAGGTALAVLDAPTGTLPEWIGGLGTAINARYRFAGDTGDTGDTGDNGPPTRLTVTRGTDQARFTLSSSDSGSER